MASDSSRFSLANWRRTVSEMYADVRSANDSDRSNACQRFRQARDALFRDHPDTPLSADRKAEFSGIEYFPYHAKWRITGIVEAITGGETFELQLSRDGVQRVTPFGKVHFEAEGESHSITAFWFEGYGGGAWVPFRDATSGKQSFGAGRYLYDTIKGADLGVDGDRIVLDFNYAYNPSCAYNDHWVCPLVPRENVLPFAVEAGEKQFR